MTSGVHCNLEMKEVKIYYIRAKKKKKTPEIQQQTDLYTGELSCFCCIHSTQKIIQLSLQNDIQY